MCVLSVRLADYAAQNYLAMRGRYGKRIFSYDVINETIDSKTGELRDTLLVRQLSMLPSDVPTRDKEVADFTRGYLDLMLSYPQTRYVMAWGMVDRAIPGCAITVCPSGLALMTTIRTPSRCAKRLRMRSVPPPSARR